MIFKKLSELYKNKIQKRSIKKFFIILITIFSVIGVIYGGIQGIKSIYSFTESKFFSSRFYYKKISKINTGMNTAYIDQLFGIPTPMKKIDYVIEDIKRNEKEELELIKTQKLIVYTEKVYIFKQFNLYTICDDSGSIKYYAITIKNKKFNPPIKIALDKYKLGKMKLSDLSGSVEYIFADLTPKFMCYTETLYFGNPGFYKNYQFGYSPSGCPLQGDSMFMKMGEIAFRMIRGHNISYDDIIVRDFRENFKPNSFAVMDFVIEDRLREDLLNSMIGLHFLEGREYLKR